MPRPDLALDQTQAHEPSFSIQCLTGISSSIKLFMPENDATDRHWHVVLSTYAARFVTE